MKLFEIEEFADLAISLLDAKLTGPAAHRLVVAAIFGAAAYEKSTDGDAAPIAMMRAILLAMKDPMSTDLDYLRARHTQKVTAD